VLVLTGPVLDQRGEFGMAIFEDDFLDAVLPEPVS
jgi:hypothetical protein